MAEQRLSVKKRRFSSKKAFSQQLGKGESQEEGKKGGASACNSKCTHKNPFIHPLVREYHGKPIRFKYHAPGFGEEAKLYLSTIGLGTVLGLQSYFHKRKAVHYPYGICGRGTLLIDHEAQKFFRFPAYYQKVHKQDGGFTYEKTHGYPFYLRHTHNMFHAHSLRKGPKSLSLCSPLMDWTMLSGEACPFWDYQSFLDFIEFQRSRTSNLLALQPCLWNSALCVAPCYSYLECNYYSMVTYDFKDRWLIRFRVLPFNVQVDTRTPGSPVYLAFKELCFADFYNPADAKQPADFLNREYRNSKRRTYVMQYAKIDKTQLCPIEIKHRRNAAVPWYDQDWKDFATFQVADRDVEEDKQTSRFTNRLAPGFSLANPESMTDPAAIAWMRTLIYPWMSCLRP